MRTRFTYKEGVYRAVDVQSDIIGPLGGRPDMAIASASGSP